MRWTTRTLQASLVTVVVGCATQRPQCGQQTMTEAIDAPWSVTYHDGSGNQLRFRQESGTQAARFVYDPVRPEHSSSGSYSGGEPAEGTVDKPQVVALWSRLRALEADPSLRAPSRMKGTGDFSLTTPGGTSTFIIMRGPRLAELDAFVRSVVRPPKTE